MTAVAGQFYGFSRISTILAAKLAIAECNAVAGRMSTFFNFSHD